MAEAIFKHLVKEAGLESRFDIDSAGTSGYHEGHPYHRDTIAVVEKNKIEITGRSRPVRKDDFSSFDYVLAMDTSNYEDMRRLCADDARFACVSHMLEHSQTEYIPGLDVPDPYYGGRDGFEHVFTLLRDACEGLLKKIRAEKSL